MTRPTRSRLYAPDSGLRSSQEITQAALDGNPLTEADHDIALGGGRKRSRTIEAFDGQLDMDRIHSAFDGRIDMLDQDRRREEAAEGRNNHELDAEPQPLKPQSTLPSPWQKPKPTPFER